jgi:hypothetical protein
LHIQVKANPDWILAAKQLQREFILPKEAPMPDQTVTKRTPSSSRSATNSQANASIKISAESYDRLLSHADKESHLYSILKGGLIFDDNQRQGKVVKILCDEPAAELLLKSASIFCPEAIEEIRQIIHSFRHAKEV